MRVFIIGALLMGLQPASTLAQGIDGGLVYQTVKSAGRGVPIYGLDPADPTYSVRGNNLALYARRAPVVGSSYVAELWMGPAGATEAGLAPVAGTRTVFRDDLAVIRGNSQLRIPGTLGGQVYTFQLRVWGKFSLDAIIIESWEDVLANPNAVRGSSSLTRLTLGNVDAENRPYVPPNLAFFLEGFGLYIVPEPSAFGLAACAFVGLLLQKGRRQN